MQAISYDFHLHSCLSPCANDDMTPANLVGMAVVSGLDAIAVTDHNSCRNCRAAMKVGEGYGITVIPGMELCTKEEVHVLCLFYQLKDAEAFSEYVHNHMVQISNQPEYFGNQFILNEEDERIGEEEYLLIAASTIGFEEVWDKMKEYHGIMIPAHLDKQNNSLVSQLGFIPENSRFQCFELRNLKNLEQFHKDYPYLARCRAISDSDAHQLCDVNDPVNWLHVEENTIEAILNALEK